MNEIEFKDFNHVNRKDLLVTLNQQNLREHLVDHAYFDAISLNQWIKAKVEIDSLPGCRIRVIYIGGVLAGWCGIQPDEKGFEVAIVISQRFWGSGIPIFKVLMKWAKELGHKEILVHLLESRPEYRALKKMASKVHKTKQLGRCFTTYYFAVKRGVD